MRLEAIAALLGHQKMEMTLIYAKIANRVVADEYAAVSAKIDALYGQPPEHDVQHWFNQDRGALPSRLREPACGHPPRRRHGSQSSPALKKTRGLAG
jgi:hypothetical protein